MQANEHCMYRNYFTNETPTNGIILLMKHPLIRDNICSHVTWCSYILINKYLLLRLKVIIHAKILFVLNYKFYYHMEYLAIIMLTVIHKNLMTNMRECITSHISCFILFSYIFLSFVLYLSFSLSICLCINSLHSVLVHHINICKYISKVIVNQLLFKMYIFFPGPLAFCKKAVERVNSEKNILNSSVECVEWSWVEWSGFF